MGGNNSTHNSPQSSPDMRMVRHNQHNQPMTGVGFTSPGFGGSNEENRAVTETANDDCLVCHNSDEDSKSESTRSTTSEESEDCEEEESQSDRGAESPEPAALPCGSESGSSDSASSSSRSSSRSSQRKLPYLSRRGKGSSTEGSPSARRRAFLSSKDARTRDTSPMLKHRNASSSPTKTICTTNEEVKNAEVCKTKVEQKHEPGCQEKKHKNTTKDSCGRTSADDDMKELEQGCAYLSKKELRMTCEKYQAYGQFQDNAIDYSRNHEDDECTGVVGAYAGAYSEAYSGAISDIYDPASSGEDKYSKGSRPCGQAGSQIACLTSLEERHSRSARREPSPVRGNTEKIVINRDKSPNGPKLLYDMYQRAKRVLAPNSEDEEELTEAISSERAVQQHDEEEKSPVRRGPRFLKPKPDRSRSSSGSRKSKNHNDLIGLQKLVSDTNRHLKLSGKHSTESSPDRTHKPYCRQSTDNTVDEPSHGFMNCTKTDRGESKESHELPRASRDNLRKKRASHDKAVRPRSPSPTKYTIVANRHVAVKDINKSNNCNIPDDSSLQRENKPDTNNAGNETISGHGRLEGDESDEQNNRADILDCYQTPEIDELWFECIEKDTFVGDGKCYDIGVKGAREMRNNTSVDQIHSSLITRSECMIEKLPPLQHVCSALSFEELRKPTKLENLGTNSDDNYNNTHSQEITQPQPKTRESLCSFRPRDCKSSEATIITEIENFTLHRGAAEKLGNTNCNADSLVREKKRRLSLRPSVIGEELNRLREALEEQGKPVFDVVKAKAAGISDLQIKTLMESMLAPPPEANVETLQGQTFDIDLARDLGLSRQQVRNLIDSSTQVTRPNSLTTLETGINVELAKIFGLNDYQIKKLSIYSNHNAVEPQLTKSCGLNLRQLKLLFAPPQTQLGESSVGKGNGTKDQDEVQPDRRNQRKSSGFKTRESRAHEVEDNLPAFDVVTARNLGLSDWEIKLLQSSVVRKNGLYQGAVSNGETPPFDIYTARSLGLNRREIERLIATSSSGAELKANGDGLRKTKKGMTKRQALLAKLSSTVSSGDKVSGVLSTLVEWNSMLLIVIFFMLLATSCPGTARSLLPCPLPSACQLTRQALLITLGLDYDATNTGKPAQPGPWITTRIWRKFASVFQEPIRLKPPRGVIYNIMYNIFKSVTHFILESLTFIFYNVVLPILSLPAIIGGPIIGMVYNAACCTVRTGIFIIYYVSGSLLGVPVPVSINAVRQEQTTGVKKVTPASPPQFPTTGHGHQHPDTSLKVHDPPEAPEPFSSAKPGVTPDLQGLHQNGGFLIYMGFDPPKTGCTLSYFSATMMWMLGTLPPECQ